MDKLLFLHEKEKYIILGAKIIWYFNYITYAYIGHLFLTSYVDTAHFITLYCIVFTVDIICTGIVGDEGG